MRDVRDVVAAIAGATARERVLIAARRGAAMERPWDQLAALLDLSRALSKAGIPYAVIGGVAVGIHTEAPRATVDVDVAVPSTVPRAEVARTLEAAGFVLGSEFAHSVDFRHPSGEPVQWPSTRGSTPWWSGPSPWGWGTPWSGW